MSSIMGISKSKEKYIKLEIKKDKYILMLILASIILIAGSIICFCKSHGIFGIILIAIYLAFFTFMYVKISGLKEQINIVVEEIKKEYNDNPKKVENENEKEIEEEKNDEDMDKTVILKQNSDSVNTVSNTSTASTDLKVSKVSTTTNTTNNTNDIDDTILDSNNDLSIAINNSDDNSIMSVGNNEISNINSNNNLKYTIEQEECIKLFFKGEVKISEQNELININDETYIGKLCSDDKIYNCLGFEIGYIKLGILNNSECFIVYLYDGFQVGYVNNDLNLFNLFGQYLGLFNSETLPDSNLIGIIKRNILMRKIMSNKISIDKKGIIKYGKSYLATIFEDNKIYDGNDSKRLIGYIEITTLGFAKIFCYDKNNLSTNVAEIRNMDQIYDLKENNIGEFMPNYEKVKLENLNLDSISDEVSLLALKIMKIFCKSGIYIRKEGTIFDREFKYLAEIKSDYKIYSKYLKDEKGNLKVIGKIVSTGAVGNSEIMMNILGNKTKMGYVKLKDKSNSKEASILLYNNYDVCIGEVDVFKLL